MKKIGFILMACALIFGTTQCKKNDETNSSENNGESVFITLNVGGGTRAEVVPEDDIAPVYYAEGDMIHVASDGKYVGTLTYNGSNFSGDITNPTQGQPLHFYFLGNVTPTETLFAGTTEECSVIISDQTEHLPVISCAASNENYVSGVTAYSAHLLNKCALVKFNVTTPSNSPICITGMKNKVTVDFTQNTITPSMDGEGVIMLPAGSGENVEKWAILLPQEALEEGIEGSIYSEDGLYMGVRPAIPAIIENDYLVDGINLILEDCSISLVPEGAINGLFTVNAYGDQAYFSQGNLQYRASTNTWRFAENQYDIIGNANTNISSYYSDWIDLFGWGTSGYNHGGNCYQPWSTSQAYSDYYAYGNYTYNLYNQTGNADWGYNPISNGGNQPSQWHTLKHEEWVYVFDTRPTVSGIRYVKARVNYVKGVILLPDDWNSSYYTLNNINQSGVDYSSNVINTTQWNTIEQHGAVFLPAAGSRFGTSIDVVDIYGYYWSASASYVNNNIGAYGLDFCDSYLRPQYPFNRRYGFSVRLVQDYNP